jgi:DNA-binding transcriptional MerR regulator
MMVKQRDPAAAAAVASHDSGIDLDKPIFTLSVASEILEVHPRTLMMYEHLSMIHPRRTVTNRRRYSRRDVMKLQAIQALTREHHVNLAGVRFILALLKRLHNAGVDPPADLRNLDVSQLDV